MYGVTFLPDPVFSSMGWNCWIWFLSWHRHDGCVMPALSCSRPWSWTSSDVQCPESSGLLLLLIRQSAPFSPSLSLSILPSTLFSFSLYPPFHTSLFLSLSPFPHLPPLSLSLYPPFHTLHLSFSLSSTPTLSPLSKLFSISPFHTSLFLSLSPFPHLPPLFLFPLQNLSLTLTLTLTLSLTLTLPLSLSLSPSLSPSLTASFRL